MGPADSTPRDTEVVGAIVMPHQGQSDEHVTSVLLGLGAKVRPLAKGFLSVTASRNVLRSVASIARVEEKTTKQTRY